MKNGLILIFLFLFFHSLSGENKPDLKNLGNLFPKNFHAVQTGISTVQVSSFIPYQEELKQQWSNDNWVSTQKIITTVDTSNWTMVANYSINNPQTGWQNQSKFEYYFKVFGTTIGFLQLKMYAFSGADWKLQAQMDFSYDANDFLILVNQQMDFGAGLMPYSTTTYTNNSAGLPLTETIEQINFATFTMENYRKTTYLYNLNPKDLQTETRSDWRTNQWVDTLRTSYKRNANFLPTTELYQTFTAPSTLQNLNQYDYTYDGSNSYVMVRLYKYWDTNTNNWIESQKIIYTYSATNNVLSALDQRIDQNAWKDESRTTNYYSVDDNITKELYESYLSLTWVNQGQSLYSYNPTSVENGAITINDFELSDNFPNPFNPTTSINYELAAEGFVTLKVFDILGNEVAQLVHEFKAAGKYQISFDAKNISSQQLSSGTYFYQLQTEGRFRTKKMVLLR